MKLVLFYHSFLSCWNHGNAHFLRGIARELIGLGHEVIIYEPQDGWSRTNALAERGAAALAEVAMLVPGVKLRSYADNLDIEEATDHADAVLVHEWNSPALIAALGRQRATGAPYTLLFHDSHHRAVSAPAEMNALDLDGYDAVLAFGEKLREAYLRRGWARHAFTWHEAADTALFRPLPVERKEIDLIWIGNWGDGERSRELETFLIQPARRLALRTRVHGVRYPTQACEILAASAIEYAGWLPNHHVPDAFSRALVTMHVPRRPYTAELAGIPTIRVFEALACGIPLVCSPWRDEEGLFPSECFLTAANEDQMTKRLATVLADRDLSEHLVASGLRIVRERHSCARRASELLSTIAALRQKSARTPSSNLELQTLGAV